MNCRWKLEIILECVAEFMVRGRLVCMNPLTSDRNAHDLKRNGFLGRRAPNGKCLSKPFLWKFLTFAGRNC